MGKSDINQNGIVFPETDSWRYRKTVRTRLYNWFWTLVLILLWPLSVLLRGWEKLISREK